MVILEGWVFLMSEEPLYPSNSPPKTTNSPPKIGTAPRIALYRSIGVERLGEPGLYSAKLKSLRSSSTGLYPQNPSNFLQKTATPQTTLPSQAQLRACTVHAAKGVRDETRRTCHKTVNLIFQLVVVNSMLTILWGS